MFKLIKTPILSLEGREEIGINNNYRTTMGYNTATKQIKVSVDKVVRPDLTRDEDVELSYDNVDERFFSVSDFPKNYDSSFWFVDFDVTTEKIIGPIEMTDFITSLNLPAKGAPHWNRTVATRYNSNLLPCFSLGIFDKDSVDFNQAMLIFHIVNAPGAYGDTVLENEAELMTNQERIDWYTTVKPDITFDLLDSEGNVDSSAVFTKEYPCHYKVQLAHSDVYNFKFNFNKENFPTVVNTYEVVTVNCTTNKNRISSANGSSNLTITSSGLTAGDYIKVKLTAGRYLSYAELWIEIV
jgi:hypothetical protein